MLWDTTSLHALHVTTYTFVLFTGVKITKTELRALNCVLRIFQKASVLNIRSKRVGFCHGMNQVRDHGEASQPEMPAVDICLISTLVSHSISLNTLNRMH